MGERKRKLMREGRRSGRPSTGTGNVFRLWTPAPVVNLFSSDLTEEERKRNEEYALERAIILGTFPIFREKKV